MTHALIAKVAAHLLAGGTLSTHRHLVGPLRSMADDRVRFSCMTHGGILVDAWEHWTEDHEVAPDGETIMSAAQRRRDWTAFGAARAFVAVTHPNEVEKAFRIERVRAEALAAAPVPRRRVVIDVERYNRRARWGAQ